ncbi:MAG: cell division protein ZapA [Dinoroseobacter sp.]|nr:cell division protein ZapA [Dinoroseobacter sp.]NQZ74104.1 cell division protein ZapA [Dinoroseobacter sp.]
MPDVEVSIGGRSFAVACQDGEQVYLQSAAQILDNEAQVLADQLGRMTEARMLLMAGLMLADKTAGLEEELRRTEAAYAEVAQSLEDARNTPAAEPEQIEVPMIPPSVTETLAELAAQAEAVADQVDAKKAS